MTTVQRMFNIGEVVKYSNPVNNDEINARFIVLEISPASDGLSEKLFVEFICDLYIKPINCFFSTEFVKA